MKSFNVERLYDYTKFHIGLYTTLVAGLLTVSQMSLGKQNSEYPLLLITAALFALAGACGGLICTTCTYVRDKQKDIEANHIVTLWSPKVFQKDLEWLTNWEHRFSGWVLFGHFFILLHSNYV